MKEENKNLKIRIQALILSGFIVILLFPLVAIFVSLFIDSILSLPFVLPFPFNIYLGIIFLIVGAFWAGWSNIDIFRKGNGTPIPLKNTQTTTLVVKGPYKYCRNPMVFGYILIWIGLGFLFNSYFLLIGFSLIVTLLLVAFVKLWEEKDLEKRFRKSYVEYKKTVSFLFPLPRKK